MLVIFLFFIFAPPFISSLDLYVQSNLTLSQSGLSPQTALQDINSAFSQIISNGGTIYLLPSTQEYLLNGTLTFSQQIALVSYNPNFPASVVLSNDFNANLQNSLTFTNLKITRKSSWGYVEKIFYMNGGSTLTLQSVEISNIIQDGYWNRFIQGGPCVVTFNSCQIINNDLTRLACFIEVWAGSTLTFNNSLFSNVTLSKNSLLKIWDPPTLFIISNSIFTGMDLNRENSDGNLASFALTNAQHQYFNVSFINLVLNQGSLVRYFANNGYQKNIFNATQCTFKNITASNKGMVIELIKIIIEVHFQDCHFLNNTNYNGFGSLIRLFTGQNSTVYVSNAVIMYNFALFIESQYTKYFFFSNVYIFSNNMRSLTDRSTSPYQVCYFESSADFVFTNFTIDGAWSDRDVAGLKIHINSDILYLPDIDVSARINAGIPISMNFTNCYFRNISSTNKNWMDTGSGISFHSNIPINVIFANTSFIGNINDKGATCMEIYGQNVLSFMFIGSIFSGNSALMGSPCLAVYILSVSFDGCLFFNNTLIPYFSSVNDFIEGTNGGALFSETNITIFKNSEFDSNAAYYGGVFYFYDENIPLINISISNCTFQNNRAKLGGTLSLLNVFYSVSLLIVNSSFINNQALNGGCFYLNFFSLTSEISIKNNFFTSNNGLKGGVAFISAEGFPLFFDSNSFIVNKAWNFDSLNVLSYGGVYYLSEEASSLLTSTNNQYKNNTSYNGGGVYSINRGFVNESKSNYQGNSAKNQAGSIVLRNSAILKIFSCRFKNESSNIWGGSIALTENSDLFISNSNFSGCHAKQGGVLYIENHYNLTVFGSIFTQNLADAGGVMLVYTSSQNLSFHNCFFLSNPSQKYLMLVTSSSGTFLLSSSIARNNNCTLLGVTSSKAIIESSNISYSNCSDSSVGCVLYAEESNTTLKLLNLLEIQIKTEGSLFYYLNCPNAVVQNIQIDGVLGLSKGGCLEGYSSNVIVRDSRFFAIAYGCLYLSSSFHQVINTTFDNGDPQNFSRQESPKDLTEYGSFIYIENSFNTSIEACSFNNNYQGLAMNGGAIKAINAQTSNILSITNSKFSNNLANSMGGAIYLQSQPFILFGSEFINNSAISGGAVYFTEPTLNVSKPKNITGNTFRSNTASIQGGAIFFRDNPMDLTSENLYDFNNASYGPHLASFPVYLRVRVYNSSQNASQMIMFDSFENSINSLILTSFPTGKSSDFVLQVSLLDFFNQTINVADTGLGHIQAVNSEYLDITQGLYNASLTANNLSKKYDFDNQKLSLSGVLDSYNKDGVSLFKDLAIYATPTSSFNLFISNDLLIEYFSQPTPNFKRVNSTVGLLIPVSIRGCVAGELYIKDINYCSECPIGKFSVNSKDSVCQDCPAHATCPGGSTITISQYYWRSPETDDVNIYYCAENPQACLGGVDNECEDGYQGPLCSVCQQVHFTKIGKYCVTCLDTSWNAVMIIGMLLAYGILLFFMIKSNQKVKPDTFITHSEDKFKPPNKSLFYKILIDHVQFIGIAENIGFEAPGYFQLMNNVQSGSVYFVQQLFSFDCFVKYSSNNFDLSQSSILIRTAVVAFLPVFSVLCIISFWLVYYNLRKTKKITEAITKVTASVVVTLFLLQPTILNSMSRLFACMKLGKESFVVADMNLKCWDSEHVTMILIFALPCLIVWNILFPIFCLYKITQNRKNLKHEDTVLKYGFMYNGFDHRSFYWGFVKYFQKAVIIILRMSNLESGQKMLTILFVWITTITWNRFHEVYVHKILNDLEFQSSFINMLTLFLSLYLYVGVDEQAKSGILILIVVCNIYFITVWITTFLHSQRKELQSTIKRLKDKIHNTMERNSISSVRPNKSMTSKSQFLKNQPK